MYEISVLTEPEIFNGKPKFFWCIFGIDGEIRHNCGHGWSDSISEAAEDAEKYYQEVVKNR